MVRLKNLSKTYLLGNKPVEALKDISFEIPPHQFVSILGKSGSGKSSLLNLIAGLDQPTQGEIWVGEQSLATRTRSELAHYRSHSIGIVFQSFHLVSHRSAFQNVELPLIFQGVSQKERQRRVEESLEEVGLAHRMYHKPPQLSGGERQRVAIARAIISRPPLLLADEPTGNLDSKTSQDILELFVQIFKQSQSTLLLITHDREIAHQVSTTLIELQDGRLVRFQENLPLGISR